MVQATASGMAVIVEGRLRPRISSSKVGTASETQNSTVSMLPISASKMCRII